MSDDRGGRREDRYREERPWQDLHQMLTVDDARERILSSVGPCEPESVMLEESHGLVLAQDVVAASPVPPFRNSAMDGYAVRAADVQDATYDTPVQLNVVANLPAGQAPETAVGQGEAIRIMTGAAMPDGADTVVRFEETDDPATSEVSDASELPAVEIRRAPRNGDNVREAGEDIPEGVCVLRPGIVIDAATLGVLASVNYPQVQAVRRPRVGILATGDEVVDPGEPIQRGQIRNSNNYMLSGLVLEAGGIPTVLGVAGDTASDIRDHLADANKYDLLVTSGGVSLGDYDVVKDVLQSEGRIELWQVRIKPGKPMAFGTIGNVPLIGLPGNPVAAFVAFLQFAGPAIRKMRGLPSVSPAVKRARLTCEHENRGQRRHFVRGVYSEQDDELVVEPVPVQGSGVLTSVMRANCFFIIPETVTYAPAGQYVEVIPLSLQD